MLGLNDANIGYVTEGHPRTLNQQLPIFDEYGNFIENGPSTEQAAVHLGPTSCDIMGVLAKHSSSVRPVKRPNTIFARTINIAYDRFTYAMVYVDTDQLYRISSTITMNTEYNQPGNRYIVSGDIGKLRDPGDFILPTTICLSDSIFRERVSQYDMAALFEGPTINPHEIRRVLLGTLQPSSGNQNLRIFTDAASISYDAASVPTSMVAVYAKLLFYAMLRERFLQDDIEPKIQPITDAATELIYINTHATNNNVQNLQTIAADGYISFFASRICPEVAIPVLEILGFTGRYFQVPAGAKRLPAAYYQLPGIRVVYFDTAPHQHVAKDVTPEQLKNFAIWMAKDRGEHGDLMDGLMMAIELIHSDALPHSTVKRQERFRLLDARWQTFQSPWPTPFDIGWPLRAFYIRHEPQIIPTGFDKLNSTSVREILVSAVWISELLRVCTSTVLFNVSATGTVLNQYMLGNAPDGFQHLASNGFLYPPITDTNTPAYVFSSADELLHSITQYSYPWAQHKRVWNNNRHFDDVAGDAGIYICNFAGITPRINSVMAVNCLLVARPLEWAISTPVPQANISNYLRRGSLQPEPALYTHMGDIYYRELNDSEDFSTSVTFGTALINLLVQGPLRHYRDEMIFRYMHAYRQPNSILAWQPTPAADYRGFQWIGDSSIIEPLTIRSYDWHHDRYLAPVLVMNHRTLDVLRSILANRSTPINGAGVLLEFGVH